MSTWFRNILSLTFAVALVMTAFLPSHAAPVAQEAEDNVFETPLVGDVQENIRGAFVLLSQAERATGGALQLVDQNDVMGNLLGGDFSFLEDEEAIAEFRILQPSTIVTLRAVWETLGVISEGLDDFELLLEADIAEELTLSQEVLRSITVEDDSGIIETEEESDTDVPNIEGILDAVDVDVEIANGECGDLDTLVRVSRNDIARALGVGSMLGVGGEFAVETELDPDVRLLALTALAAHHEQLQDALVCLSTFN